MMKKNWMMENPYTYLNIPWAPTPLKTCRVHCGIVKPVLFSGLEAEGSIIYLSCWVSSKTEGTDGRPLASIPIERSAYVPCAVAAAMSSGQSKNACIYLLIDCVSLLFTKGARFQVQFNTTQENERHIQGPRALWQDNHPSLSEPQFCHNKVTRWE